MFLKSVAHSGPACMRSITCFLLSFVARHPCMAPGLSVMLVKSNGSKWLSRM